MVCNLWTISYGTGSLKNCDLLGDSSDFSEALAKIDINLEVFRLWILYWWYSWGRHAIIMWMHELDDNVRRWMVDLIGHSTIVYLKRSEFIFKHVQ